MFDVLAVYCMALFYLTNKNCCQSQWPRGLRRRCAAARFLGLLVRIPLKAWMSLVSVVYSADIGLSVGLITLPEECYRMFVCVCVCVCLSVIMNPR